MPSRDEALPLVRVEPALRWCLGGAAPEEGGDPPPVADAAVAGWWGAMAAARAGFGHVPLLSRDRAGALVGLAWLAPPPAEADLVGQEQAFEALLDTLETLADEDAVTRYLTYAEAVDSLQPEAPCHSLSGVVVATSEALGDLVGQALAAMHASHVGTGLLAECADRALGPDFSATGASAAGEVWLPGLAVQGWWWPRADAG